MLHANLKSFIDTLKKEGELKVIDQQVDPYLELAEVHRRVVAAKGPALFFSQVQGTPFPVVTNLFGSRRRIDLAFGKDPTLFVRRVAEAAETLMPPRPKDLWQFRDVIRTAIRTRSRRVRSGPVLERALDPGLGSLPQIQSWPGDGGPFITLPLVYTEHPTTRKPNLGMYRNQFHDDRTLGMHFQIHRGGGFHYYEAEKQGCALPANLFLGGPPALILAAIAPLPENIPELTLAALLQGGPLALIDNPQVSSLPIVAEAEFILSGEIPPKIRRTEGPFGDHYGYYSLAHPFPVMEVKRIRHRKDAIYPATVVGRPRQEDHYIGEYLQELFAPVYPLVMNGVLDVWAYDDAGVHPLASAVVQERYRREAFMASLRILGEGQLSLTKFLMVTDKRMSLKDFRSVFMHILERADFATDLFIFSNVSQDTLDYTSRTQNEGSKAIMLGLGEKKFQLQQAPEALLRNPAFRQQVVFVPGVLVVQGPPWRENDSAISDLLQEIAVQSFRIVCLVDDAASCVENESSFLWTVFTRFEPAADIHSRISRLRRQHVSMSAPLLLDCRTKPWFPPPVEPHPDTVKKVDALWPKIFAASKK